MFCVCVFGLYFFNICCQNVDDFCLWAPWKSLILLWKTYVFHKFNDFVPASTIKIIWFGIKYYVKNHHLIIEHTLLKSTCLLISFLLFLLLSCLHFGKLWAPILDTFSNLGSLLVPCWMLLVPSWSILGASDVILSDFNDFLIDLGPDNKEPGWGRVSRKWHFSMLTC